MRNYFRKLALDKFLRSVLVLASGTLISQLIILATLPLVTRLYTPAEYGTYSIYLSVMGILLMLVSFSYENAVTLPEDDKTASSVLGLCLLICSGVSVVSGIAIYLLQQPLSVWLQDRDLPHYSLLFAISLFFGGCYQILNYWLIRKKHYHKLARTKYTQSIGQVSSQITLSLFHFGPLGLIAGDILGRFGGLLPQWKQWRSDMRQHSIRLKWPDLRESAYRYRRFPQLSLASNMLNSVVIYLPTIWLATFYGVHVAGWFALGQRILGSPMTLIMSSVRNVYLAESSQYMISDPGQLRPLFLKTVRHVFVLGLAIIAVFFTIGPAAFSLLFGDEWRESGHYIRILSVMYLSQFVANSVGSTIDVMERQELHLYREIIRAFIIASALVLALYTNQTPEMVIMFFSLASTLGYVLHLGLSWMSIKKYESGGGNGEVGALRRHALGAGEHPADPAPSDEEARLEMPEVRDICGQELYEVKLRWLREQREIRDSSRLRERITYADAARHIMQAAGQGTAGQDEARQDEGEQDEARQDEAERNEIRQQDQAAWDEARQSEVGQGETRQGGAGQNQAKQDEARQDEDEQDEGPQNEAAQQQIPSDPGLAVSADRASSDSEAIASAEPSEGPSTSLQSGSSVTQNTKERG
ncbi:oligosaccharide flippase family protein [Paenibacillus sp. YPG26]|uniref:oligosaccharide flippase family protein n=1 Tax=Paenibacillus sp. YPG26 TaxID=2878915 RepID=UPI00203F3DFF|nr:oligosaccharide flippase family protein [Paenibacillus sp. YPG26]USB33029.1 oligosaccharide flippase family protein [Paenibacillus sp. YPG26]